MEPTDEEVHGVPMEARSQWKCTGCVIDAKVAELTHREVPPVRDAITMMGGTLACYDHIQVQARSPLLAPGAPVNGIHPTR